MCEADITLGSGTGQPAGDIATRNLGAMGSQNICNFDDGDVTLNSYFESWARWDLSELVIPDGEDLLYAGIRMKVSNNTGNGYNCYHLMDIDDWEEGNGNRTNLSTEGGLTWNDAQAYDFENEENYTLVKSNPLCGGGQTVEEFDVTSVVNYELGPDGNKLLTLRFEPYIKEYDPVTSPKVWLGFYAKEATHGTHDPVTGYNVDASWIIFYFGPPQPTEFSDVQGFGDIGNYMRTPDKFRAWAVIDDEDEARLVIMDRPPPINGTPGGLAIYNSESYGDFDISVKAKLNKIKSDVLDPKADFIIVFGYKGNLDYSYIRFTGEDINGFYQVDPADGGTVTEIGDLNATPAVADTNYHDYRLVRSGTTVTAYIDDVEYMSVTDDALGAEGKIGMGSYNDIALFDDFQEGAGEPGSVSEFKVLKAEIFPNPAREILQVNAREQISSIVIQNILGQELFNISDLGSKSANLNVGGYEPGIYILSIESYSGNWTSKRFVIE